MSQRGECQAMIVLMKTVVKKVERCISSVDTYYKTEGIPQPVLSKKALALQS
jgi:hypothetical protein